MKNLRIFLILVSVLMCALLSNITNSQVYPYTYWNKLYNAPSNLQDSAVAIARNNAGMLFVGGWSLGSSTNKDIVCIRYNPENGDTIWVYRFASATEDLVNAMACNDNAVYLTGTTFSPGPSRDIITIKLNAVNGAVMWQKTYNGPGLGGDYSHAIALDFAGNAYICGRVGDVGNVSHYIIAKYDVTTGNFAANSPFIYNVGFATSADEARSIAVDGSGNVYVTGERAFTTVGDMMTLRLNSNFLLAWIKVHSGIGGDGAGVSVKLDNTASFVYAGGFSERSFLHEYIVLKYNALTGDSTAFAFYNGPTNGLDIMVSMTIDGSNNITATGKSQNVPANKYEIATVRWNSNLVQQWAARTSNTQGWDIANYIVAGTGNDVYVVGSRQQTNQGYNMFTIRYNAAGDTIWTKTENGGASGNDYGSQVAVMDSQHIYVTGSVVSSGSTSMYTLRYSNEIVSIRPISGEVPKSYNLYQNLPNPFNPSTTIRFDVPKTTMVKITIFDAVGRQLEVLANEELAAGKYEADWNASEYSSGVYFFNISTRDFSETKKMVLAK